VGPRGTRGTAKATAQSVKISIRIEVETLRYLSMIAGEQQRSLRQGVANLTFRPLMHETQTVHFGFGKGTGRD
jgi:hypothetical protein